MPLARYKITAEKLPTNDAVLIVGTGKVEAVNIQDEDHPFDESYIRIQGNATQQWYGDLAFLSPDGISKAPTDDVVNKIRRVGVTHCVRSLGSYLNRPIIGPVLDPDTLAVTDEELTHTEIGVCVVGSPYPDETSEDYQAALYNLRFGNDLETNPTWVCIVDNPNGNPQEARPRWFEKTTWSDKSPVRDGKGQQLDWKWSHLADLRVCLESVEAGGGGQPFVDGPTECTFLEVLVDYAPHWAPCARCCCCCLCRCPTIEFDADIIEFGLNFDPDGGPFFGNPAFSLRLCNHGPFGVGGIITAPCWFYCETPEQEEGYPEGTSPPCVLAEGTLLGVGSGGGEWYYQQTSLIAGNTDVNGCSYIIWPVSLRLPYAGGYVEIAVLITLNTTKIVQCKPYHISTIPDGDPVVGGVSYLVGGGGGSVPGCPGTPGDTLCFREAGGNYTITCEGEP